MKASEAAIILRVFDALEKSIDEGRPDLAKEHINKLRSALLNDMSNS